MRVWTKWLVFMMSVVHLSSAMAASSITGVWTTMDDKTGTKRADVRLFMHNGVLNGTVAKVYPHPGDTGICGACPGEFKDKPVLGLQIIWDLKEKSPNAWYGGKILDAKTGKIYHVKMTVKGNKLYVRGYVGVSILGRTQVWLRKEGG